MCMCVCVCKVDSDRHKEYKHKQQNKSTMTDGAENTGISADEKTTTRKRDAKGIPS